MYFCIGRALPTFASLYRQLRRESHTVYADTPSDGDSIPVLVIRVLRPQSPHLWSARYVVVSQPCLPDSSQL